MKIAHVKGIMVAFDEARTKIVAPGSEIELNHLRNKVFDMIVEEEEAWEAEKARFMEVIGDR
jgi:hypothetical protein